MTTMTTPTTKGWRSDVSIILLGWSVTLVGPGQYPRYTSAVKDGRPCVAQATDKAARHHRNTTYLNFLIIFKTVLILIVVLVMTVIQILVLVDPVLCLGRLPDRGRALCLELSAPNICC